MFNTGFSMDVEQLYENMDGQTIQWMRSMAERTKSVIVGSLIIKENDHYFNRLIWASPDGRLSTYDKRHLFSMAYEQRYFTAGNKKLIIEYKGWKINPMICYDLRFPVWTRNTEAVDLQFYIASWPEKRITHWDLLLKARALENQCYVAGVNRTGNDGNEIPHRGHSAIINPLGIEIASAGRDENVLNVELIYTELKKIRRQYPFLRDGDSFEIH